jgi:hypothetical protein
VIRNNLNILSSALLITGVTIGIGIFGLPRTDLKIKHHKAHGLALCVCKKEGQKDAQ